MVTTAGPVQFSTASGRTRVGTPFRCDGRHVVASVVRSVSFLALLAFRADVSLRRAERRLAMATASKKSRDAAQLLRRAPKASTAGSMEFVISEDNAGDHHWEIVGADGVVLARSGSFASHEETAQAARRFRDGAGSALFDDHAATAEPIDLLALGGGASAEEDAERWLAEDATFSREAVATWPAGR